MARLTLEDPDEKDDLLLYKPYHDVVGKDVWKTLSTKEKIIYFKDYYLLKVVIILIIVGSITGIIYSIFRHRPETVIYTIMENTYPDYNASASFVNDFMEHFSLDGNDYQISLDDNFHSNTDMYSDQRMFSYLYGERADMYIGDKGDFKEFALNANCADMREVLPEKDFEALKDKMFYIHDDANDRDVPVGISLEGNKYYEAIDKITEEPYIGVVWSTKHLDYTIAMIEYIYDLDISVTIPVIEKEESDK